MCGTIDKEREHERHMKEIEQRTGYQPAVPPLGAGPAPSLAKLLRSERVFLAARDVAEIEYRKHADAGVSVGGSVTAATRAALDVAVGAIYDEAGAARAAGEGASEWTDAQLSRLAIALNEGEDYTEGRRVLRQLLGGAP